MLESSSCLVRSLHRFRHLMVIRDFENYVRVSKATGETLQTVDLPKVVQFTTVLSHSVLQFVAAASVLELDVCNLTVPKLGRLFLHFFIPYIHGICSC